MQLVDHAHECQIGRCHGLGCTPVRPLLSIWAWRLTAAVWVPSIIAVAQQLRLPAGDLLHLGWLQSRIALSAGEW